MNTDSDIAQTLKSIEKHLETLVRFTYAEIKKRAFENADEEKAYALTGVKSRDAICKELRMSATTLSNLWSKWSDMGLLVKQGSGYKKTVE